MKIIKSTISQVIIIGFLILIIFTDYLNPIKGFLPILWTSIIIWSIIYSINYRKGNATNELRFLTNNDDYNKIYPFVIGTLLSIGGVCTMIFIQEYLIFSSLMTLNGVLLIVSGILFIPNGVISIKDKELISVSGNQKNNIKIETLNEIKLFKNEIIFIDQNQKKYNLEHLNLELSDFSKISDFINQKLDKEIEIKTYYNNT